MKCRNLQSLIQKYIDGETTSQQNRFIEAHLRSCPSCRLELSFWKEFEIYAKEEKVLPPSNFTQNILQKLEKVQAQEKYKEPIFLPALSLGWALILVAAIITSISLSASLIMKPRASVVTVRFKVSAPEASSVSVAGDFNDWDTCTHRLTREAGYWKTSIRLKPGRYHYMFIIDGEEWIPDPEANEYVDNGYGSINAVLDLKGT